MRRAEQNDRHERSSYKKWNKRQTKRAMRRAEKADPENAPKKPAFRGFSA